MGHQQTRDVFVYPREDTRDSNGILRSLLRPVANQEKHESKESLSQLPPYPALQAVFAFAPRKMRESKVCHFWIPYSGRYPVRPFRSLQTPRARERNTRTRR